MFDPLSYVGVRLSYNILYASRNVLLYIAVCKAFLCFVDNFVYNLLILWGLFFFGCTQF